ncbi:hypothetical protein PTTG_26851 [Puccinia triticina 1-1 BBBD Race 1]|uniref:C2H2-type domain-containing protein n=1 Tax=Puccinia triticina (isolate 1-1 / race 1 (BBBD)) TaxID=630390 RepID=A0A180GQR3_PUCT1|nr:hypothetical protein PTTG_26851 [Puccinia triticina 1-1 BBBD Race 1]WAR52844.1 hypothetical protein PtB15_2B272 [Puccinia triticina]
MNLSILHFLHVVTLLAGVSALFDGGARMCCGTQAHVDFQGVEVRCPIRESCRLGEGDHGPCPNSFRPLVIYTCRGTCRRIFHRETRLHCGSSHTSTCPCDPPASPSCLPKWSPKSKKVHPSRFNL